MFRALTGIWIVLLVAIVLALIFTLSIVVFIGIGLIALISIPYAYYLKWKAKKKFEEVKDYIEVEYEEVKPKQLKDSF